VIFHRKEELITTTKEEETSFNEPEKDNKNDNFLPFLNLLLQIICFIFVFFEIFQLKQFIYEYLL